MKKNILTIITVLMLAVVLTIPSTVFAESNGKLYSSLNEDNVISFKDSDEYFGNNTEYDSYISEYDIYVGVKNNKDNNTYLSIFGLSDETVDAIVNGEVEEQLLSIKKLSNDELYKRGYDDNDIAVLRGYNGEPLEEVPSLRSVLGVIYTNMTVPTKTNDVMYVKLKWWWDTLPIVQLTDTIGASWWGNSGADLQLLTTYDAYPTKCTVYYNNGQVSYPQAADIDKNHITYQIPMTIATSGTRPVAYQGVLDVSVGTRGAHSISYYHYKASYAHKEYTVGGASIGLSATGTPSFGFSINRGFNEVVHRHVSITPGGSVVREPDDV